MSGKRLSIEEKVSGKLDRDSHILSIIKKIKKTNGYRYTLTVKLK